MAFDVFISYSSKDKSTADATCAKLEASGIRCWIAPRDIRPGLEYASGIIAGIDACRVMVLILSSNANASPQVHREIERAVSKGLTIVPLRIEDIAPTQAMEYYLGSIHWLDALTPPLAKHLQQLIETVKANLQVDTTARQSAAVAGLNELPIAAVSETGPSASPALTRTVEIGADGYADKHASLRSTKMLWGVAAVAIVAAVAAAGWSISHGPYLPLQQLNRRLLLSSPRQRPFSRARRVGMPSATPPGPIPTRRRIRRKLSGLRRTTLQLSAALKEPTPSTGIRFISK